MDNLIGTIVFLLPGLLLYFWLQSFGVNAVVKHNPSEFTAYVVLLWFPVSMITLLIFNCLVALTRVFTTSNFYVVSIDDLKIATNDFRFIISYILLSVIVSYLFGVYWSVWGNKFLREVLINKVRKKRNVAPYSEYPSVWDEVFLKNELQIAEIGRIDKPDNPGLYGCIDKASRPFESERHLFLESIQGFNKKFIEDHSIPVTHSFYDVKSGSYVKLYDVEITIERLAREGYLSQEDADDILKVYKNN
ncbi:hypothetical protein [Paenibacillus sp. LjRoot56]|uniref:hypothetical protein n=1 Tax=Paenibacillus sp. LjRoot56 TaxID=3342333 RepID=UPI003ECDD133